MYEKLFNFLKLPIIIPFLPNHKFNYDYLLSGNLALSFKKVIYYIDYIGLFVNWNDRKLKSRLSLKLIKKFICGRRCKYVFNWSNSSKKMLIEVLKIPKNKQHKIKTIYPSMEPNDRLKIKDNKIRLLLLSSIAKFDKEFNFYMKGGKLTLEAFDQLKSNYKNIELIYIGYVPEKYMNYFQKIPEIKFFLKVPYIELLELYRNSDIFVFPSYGDIFGFTIIEAMAFGLPVIGINNNFAATELILNNKTGFLIETSQRFLAFPFFKYCPDWISNLNYYKNLKNEDDVKGLKNLINKLEILIENRALREEFGENAKHLLIDGILSIEHRNKELYDLFKQ